MIVNLNNIPSVWLTCDKSNSRWETFEKNMSIIGLTPKKLNGKITSPYTIGVALNHLDGLEHALHNKVLILEDDATPTHNYNSEIIVPDNADALYIGTSLYGRINRTTTYGAVIASVEGKDLLKIYNMLSLHAVVYLSDRYIQHVTDTIKEFVQSPVGGMDDAIADSMKHFNVYAVSKPMFYQKDGHSDNATLTNITPLF